MNDLRTMAARAIARPVLMRERDALDLAHRIFEAEPRALRSERWPFMSWLRAAGARPKADFDDEHGGVVVDPLPPGGHAYCPFWMEERGGPDDDLGLGMSLKDGIACLNIDTAISARGSEVCGQWFHGYDTIAAALRTALADERVKGIFLRFETPGGVVDDGIDEVAELMRENREAAGGKPVWGFCDVAASAGYWIAAQCDRLIAPRNGIVGSIGAVIVHWEYSAALKKDGIRVTPIQFGAQKTAGAAFAELSEVARTDMQAWVDQAGRDFVAAIGAGRPALTEEQCLATEARIYTGHHDEDERSALAIGLVDELMREPAAFAALVQHTEQAAGGMPGSTSKAQAQAPHSPKAEETAPPGTATATKETGSMAKPSANSAARRALERKAATARLAAIKAEEELEELDAEGEEEDVGAEGEEDEPALEGEEEDVGAEGEEDDPALEGEEEDVDAEGEEDEPPKAKGKSRAAQRAAAVMALPEAKGNEAYARTLAKAGLSPKQARAALKGLREADRTAALAGRRDRPVGGNGAGGPTSADAQTQARLNTAVGAIVERRKKRNRFASAASVR